MRFLIGIIFLITIINSPIVLADQPVQPTSSQSIQQLQQTAQKQVTKTAPVNVPQTQTATQIPTNTGVQTELSKKEQLKKSLSQIKHSVGSNTQFLTYKDLIKRSIKGIAVGIGAFLLFIITLVALKKRTAPNAQQSQGFASSTFKQTQEIDISQAVINYIKHKF